MKSKVTKNRKKGWRKVDITDVEDAIEDQRLQERTGGLVSEKADEQLFFIDTPADIKPDIDNADNKITTGRSMRESKPLKCFSVLELDPRIPAVTKYLPGHSKKNFIKATKPVTKKLIQSVESRKQTINKKHVTKRQAKELHQESYDLWSDGDPTKQLDEHFAVVTKKRRVNTPINRLKKPSGIKAVEAPHPGSSYNPTFEDHQALLQKAVTKQVNEDVLEAKIEKRMKPNYESAGGIPTEESRLAEMSQGLGINADSDSESSQSEGEGETEEKKTKTQKAKTKRQKRKQKERQKEADRKLKEKEERMREDRNMTKQLKGIKKRVDLRQRELLERAAKKQQEVDDSFYKTKRLNKKKFEDLEEDVLLSSELSGSLRTTKSANTLLEDRFKSLQKRNIIEPRSRTRFKRKFKPKYPEKKPFKEITSKSKAGGGIVVPFTQRKHGETE